MRIINWIQRPYTKTLLPKPKFQNSSLHRTCLTSQFESTKKSSAASLNSAKKDRWQHFVPKFAGSLFNSLTNTFVGVVGGDGIVGSTGGDGMVGITGAVGIGGITGGVAFSSFSLILTFSLFNSPRTLSKPQQSQSCNDIVTLFRTHNLLRSLRICIERKDAECSMLLLLRFHNSLQWERTHTLEETINNEMLQRTSCDSNCGPKINLKEEEMQIHQRILESLTHSLLGDAYPKRVTVPRDAYRKTEKFYQIRTLSSIKSTRLLKNVQRPVWSLSTHFLDFRRTTSATPLVVLVSLSV